MKSQQNEEFIEWEMVLADSVTNNVNIKRSFISMKNIETVELLHVFKVMI